VSRRVTIAVKCLLLPHCARVSDLFLGVSRIISVTVKLQTQRTHQIIIISAQSATTLHPILLLLCVSQFYVFSVLRPPITRTKVGGVTCYYNCKVSSASPLCVSVNNLFLGVSRIICVTVEFRIQLTHQISHQFHSYSACVGSNNTNDRCHVTEITL